MNELERKLFAIQRQILDGGGYETCPAHLLDDEKELIKQIEELKNETRYDGVK